MEIGIISDTHGFLDPLVFETFESCDEIWHAGDFGGNDVADQLQAFKPLRGVYGNIDDANIRHRFPENLQFECEGVSVWITHIAGRPGRYSPRVYKTAKAQHRNNIEFHAKVLICGHSHVVLVENDHKYGWKYINPGAAGHEGQHLMRTLLKIEFTEGQLKNMRLVELGPRGRR